MTRERARELRRRNLLRARWTFQNASLEQSQTIRENMENAAFRSWERSRHFREIERAN